jgi:hypothetical protein
MLHNSTYIDTDTYNKMQIPLLLDTIDLKDSLHKIRTVAPSFSNKNREYEIVYSLQDDSPGNFTRAIQELEILNTRIKTKIYNDVVLLPSFVELWNAPNSELATELLSRDDPHEAKWQLSRRYGYKLATTFMPQYARSIYEYFDAKSVLDPCAGWGDRLVAADCATGVTRYVGFDPNIRLKDGYTKMMELCGHSLESCSPEYVKYTNDFEVRFQPFEVGAASIPTASFDFAFTSPPYFDYEVYTESNPKYRNWIREFYTPLFVETARLLVPGAFFAIHVGDTSAGTIKRFLFYEVETICDMKYISKIGLVGACSNKIRDVFIFQKKK